MNRTQELEVVARHIAGMQRTRFMTRGIIQRVVEPLGYTCDGNHVFRKSDMVAIWQGKHRHAVIERPDLHPAKVVRAAEILSRTY